MNQDKLYDVAVIGGGLAGLALSIQCAKAGFKTILFEKERYPFHKVCGEYISLESWDFLEKLGIPLSKMNLPVIKKLIITAPNGKKLAQVLPLGGFGISRYKLDDMLMQIATKNGVDVMSETKVMDVKFANDIFTIQTPLLTTRAKVAAGAYGKRSNLDIKWKREFALQKPNKLNNYIGIKYHIKTNEPGDLIALHNFKNGYCGISQIEDNKFCLCYLTTARNLENCNNSIPQLEKKILCQNPHLKKIFSKSEILYATPVTISQISFAKKSQIQDHILMTGDAAGMITPLCGNGMSMAFHGSLIAFEQIFLFLQNKIPRSEMERAYIHNWQKEFGKRLKTGRIIQQFFGSTFLSNLLITVLRPFPFFTNRLIKRTHGQSF